MVWLFVDHSFFGHSLRDLGGPSGPLNDEKLGALELVTSATGHCKEPMADPARPKPDVVFSADVSFMRSSGYRRYRAYSVDLVFNPRGGVPSVAKFFGRAY
jgi:hypothetical protein